jgi:hypothetical protein
MFNVVFFYCILPSGIPTLTVTKSILISQRFMLCIILIFFVVNIYNNYWNFFLRKMWFIPTAWKAILNMVVLTFLCFLSSITMVLVSQCHRHSIKAKGGVVDSKYTTRPWRRLTTFPIYRKPWSVWPGPKEQRWTGVENSRPLACQPLGCSIVTLKDDYLTMRSENTAADASAW